MPSDVHGNGTISIGLADTPAVRILIIIFLLSHYYGAAESNDERDASL